MAKRKASKAAASGSSKKAVAKPSKSLSPQAVGKVYQLKIMLKDIRPPIWRRFQVPDCSLARELTGFTPRRTLDDIIAAVIADHAGSQNPMPAPL